MHLKKMSVARRCLTVVAASSVSAVFLSSSAFAVCSTQGQTLMKNLQGSWQGRGAVTPIDGRPERISCRITYTSEGDSRLRQSIACTGSDYRLEASSRVRCEGNTLEGSFEEKIANNTGTVRGSISANHLNIEADGPSFKGHFNVVFQGANRHTVAITQFDSAKGRQTPVASVQLSR